MTAAASRVEHDEHDIIRQFRDALASRNIIPPDRIIADGKIHRCATESRNGKGDASYLLHLDGIIPAGGFQNWQDMHGWEDWNADIGTTKHLSSEQREDLHRKREAAQQQRDAERAAAARKAVDTWDSADPCLCHPYLEQKGVLPHGIRVSLGDLVIPIRDAAEVLHSVQFIKPDRKKRYLAGGRVRGCYYAIIGKSRNTIVIAEGFATGASINEATNYAVAVAFDAGNLKPVAEAIRAKFPHVHIIIAADDDWKTLGNPGEAKAKEAAAAVDGTVAMPIFGSSRTADQTDFNDLAQASGRDAVARCINAAKRRASLFETTSSNTIMATRFEPLRWTVPGYVPEGLCILAGRQKLGKTWLAIDFAIAVAIGGFAMGSIQCEQGDVLYVDLENGLRRIQRRIGTLFPYEQSRPDMSRLHWATASAQLGPEFIQACDEWRQSVTKPALIVVDVLQRIKPVGSLARNSYENDYSMLADLQQWATQHGVSVLVLHHTRKGGADDPLEALSGSNGLSACADTTLVLDRTSTGITLYVRGRDVDEKETALAFDVGRWTIIGDAASVRRSDERNLILNVLAEATEPMSPSDVADATGLARNNTKQFLFQMSKAGEVLKAGRGRYVHPPNPPNFANQPNQRYTQ